MLRTALLLTSISLTVVTACNPKPPSDKPEKDTVAANQATEKPVPPQDSLYLKIAEGNDRLQISAAHAAGALTLKVLSDTLHELLGKADSTAVDMCKDLSFWYSAGSASLGIYSLCDNDLNMRKSIQMIRISGYPFTTEAGVTEESTYEALIQHYPGIEPLGKFIKDGQTIFVLDDLQKGIAFELSDTTRTGQCQAVLIHLPGKDPATTNIPLYPGLEKF